MKIPAIVWAIAVVFIFAVVIFFKLSDGNDETSITSPAQVETQVK